MYKTKALPQAYSPEFNELCDLFYRLEPPYGSKEIRQFNQVYERIYLSLHQEEKKRAEILVDILIDGLESPELACKIFGVV
jgi:hypothetical protein